MMRAKATALLAVMALGGCGDEAAGGGPATRDNGFYDCLAPADPSTASKFVAIHRDLTSGRLALNFGTGQVQMLEPVAGTNDSLFANAAYAWKLGLDSAVLTSIESIQTYACRRVSNGAGLPTAAGAGQQ